MQYRPFLIAAALALALPACAVNVNVNDSQWIGNEHDPASDIIAVLTTQQAAWNAGDIDGFMLGYWRSPDLRFASGGQVTSGWQETADRYHANYSDRAIMGTLSFDELQVELLSDDAAVAYGRWRLVREQDQLSGLFTLVFRNFDGDWKIVSDTTTSAD